MNLLALLLCNLSIPLAWTLVTPSGCVRLRSSSASPWTGTCRLSSSPHDQEQSENGVWNDVWNKLKRQSPKKNDQQSPDSVRRRLFGAASVSAALLASQLTAALLPQTARAASMTASESTRIAVFEKTAPSVVFLDTFTERRDVFSTNVMEVPLGSGTGFVWDAEGHVVTNFHVVRNAQAAQVAILTPPGKVKALPVAEGPQLTIQPYGAGPPSARTTGRTSSRAAASGSSISLGPRSGDYVRSVFNAKVVGVDPIKDVAVLKVDAPKNVLSPISIGTSKGIRVGQEALAIGNPFGLDHTLTAGIISGTGRQVTSPSGRPITNVLQSDAAINPGNSGGPLLDGNGNMIGMNTAIYSPSGASAGIGFAIPIDTIKFIVETLIREGRVIRPVLGISYLESKQARALGIGSGVLVLNVPPGSPAAKAGLKGTRRTESGFVEIGDIIGKVGNKVINTESDLFQALEDYKPGDMVTVTVYRVKAATEEDSIEIQTLELPIQLQSSVDLEKNMQVFSSSEGSPLSPPQPFPMQ